MTSTVMVGIPIKNASMWVKKNIDCLRKLTYDHKSIRIVYIYSKSHDNTLDILREFAKDNDFMSVEVYEEQYDPQLQRWGIQMGASIYNDLQSLCKEDYFMLMDCDVVDVPEDLIEGLMDIDADIVAPYPWSEGHRHFYDTFIFRYKNVRFHPFRPPGVGKPYPVIVDSVGTVFLARGDVFRKTKITNPYPNLSFCNNARGTGHTVVAVPYIEVFHADLEKIGIQHLPLPPDFGDMPLPGFITDEVELPIFMPKEMQSKQVELESDRLTRDLVTVTGSDRRDT